MRARALFPLLATAALAAFAPGAAAAQGNITMTLNTTTIPFATPGIVQFDAGGIENPGLTVTVQSTPANRQWALRIRAVEPNMGGYGKPASDLQWRVGTTGGWTDLSTNDVLVMQSSGTQNVTIQFRTKLSWTADMPGSYSINLVFSAERL